MKTLKHILFPALAAALLISRSANAEVPIRQPDLSVKTGIAPGFFGPNTFPVPLMNAGRLADEIGTDFAFDYFDGFIVKGASDKTYDGFFKFSMPFIKDRVGLTVWFPLAEWWYYDDAVMEARRIEERGSKNWDTGDVYVSLDLGLLKEKKYCPSLVFRSVLKTAASARGLAEARNYDAAGYFFDLTAAKSFFVSEDAFFRELRIAACVGFLCWQTDNGRQNDAPMYGGQVQVKTKAFLVDTQFSGYSGWERYGDRPMTLTCTLKGLPDAMFQPYFMFRYGFRDWPFAQYSVGVSVRPGRFFKKTIKQ